MYDVIIIGGGPAGCAAGVYCARKKMRTLLITESFGGQSIVSNDIQNWIGEKHISGLDLARKLEDHVRSFTEVEIKSPEKVMKVKTIQCKDQSRVCDFEVKTDKGKYQSKTVILAAGARRRRLNIPGEERLEGRGVAFCSTCDAPLFEGMSVAVIGGGNAGLEAVVDLLPYAAKIYLLERAKKLKGDEATQDKIRNNEKVNIILNAQPTEILGENMVTGLKYTDLSSKEEKLLEVGGVFVEIGSIPNSEIVKGLVEMDKYGQIMIDSKHSSTSQPGIFAAGDITDDPYKQNNISAGDGVKAALAAYNYIINFKKDSPANA